MSQFLMLYLQVNLGPKENAVLDLTEGEEVGIQKLADSVNSMVPIRKDDWVGIIDYSGNYDSKNQSRNRIEMFERAAAMNKRRPGSAFVVPGPVRCEPMLDHAFLGKGRIL